MSISSVEVIRDQLVVHLDAVDFQVTRPFGDTIYVSGSRYGASSCLVLVHDAMPEGTLLNVDLAEGKVLWERKLWCDHAPYIRSGGGFFHWSEVQAKSDAAYVFGLCNDIVYIEAFELTKGNPLFRFSTTYGWRISDSASRTKSELESRSTIHK